ncbi:hypothetical protein CVN76_17525 [Bacillus sp. mrc49]|nr:hypothetical protein CVN76_17525 [Bacillus sp. mrc49]
MKMSEEMYTIKNVSTIIKMWIPKTWVSTFFLCGKKTDYVLVSKKNANRAGNINVLNILKIN